MAWCPRAFFCVPHTEGRLLLKDTLTVSALTAHCDGSPMTVRGGGVPLGPWLQCRTKEWVRRLGASLRCATLHHGSGLGPAEYKAAARSFVRHTRAPLDFVIPTTPCVPSCSELSRYGLAMMERGATSARRPTLTAPARDSVWNLWVGAKKRASDRTKKLTKKKDEPPAERLDKKSPIQARITY